MARPVRLTHSHELVRVPRPNRPPLQAIARRVGLALGLVLFVAAVVLASRGGYVDGATNDDIGPIDALYYASVTVTTTGYGDITAISSSARLAAILLITPARILFLILVVGTTVEVLTDQTREFFATRKWRHNVHNHVVICGYGATGQSAARELINRGTAPSDLVAVDSDLSAIQQALDQGLVAIVGDASQRAVLEQASIATARAAVVAPNRDDTAVLITLTAREMNPDLHIVAGGREQENLHLLRQGGADEVVDATSAVGRMLGLATDAPEAVAVLDDVLNASSGLQLIECAPVMINGRLDAPDGSTVVAVMRDGRRLSPAELNSVTLDPDDRLVVLSSH